MAKQIFLFASICSYVINAMPQKTNKAIIKNAAYYVYDINQKSDSSAMGVPGKSKQITFYTFDGKPLKTIEHTFHLNNPRAKLDPTARLPRPEQYKIKDGKNVALGWSKKKGSSDKFIVFVDKHNNPIFYFRINDHEHPLSKKNIKRYSKSLDLSFIKHVAYDKDLVLFH